jgi:hypothetical protein
VFTVKRASRSDRQADAMKGQLIALADGFEIAVRRSACTHVVFGVHLEETDVGLGIDDLPVMLGLQANAGTRRDGPFTLRQYSMMHGGLRENEVRARGDTPDSRGFQTFAVRLPIPFGVFIVVQVPLGSSLNALPW